MPNPRIFFRRLMSARKESKWRKIWLSPLCLLSFFYEGIVTLRVKFYSWKLLRTRSLPCPVISVGNLTTGGTGKTPLVYFLAEWLKGKGFRTAVLSRGYGGKYSQPLGVVTDGQNILMDVRQAGDEPFLLAEKMQGIPLVIGRDRFRTGQYAIEKYRSEILILDDGYQHLALKRDVNILLLDSARPFGNGYLLPRGMLREPTHQLIRADAIILTKSSMSDNINKLKELLRPKGRSIPVFQVDYQPGEVRVFGGDQKLLPGFLEGKKIMAFAGVAEPESFRHTLIQLKAEILAMEVFPDHHWYTVEDWSQLLAKAERNGSEGLLTTEKDWVRIKAFRPGNLPLWVLSVRHSFPGEDQVRFEQFLLSRLGR